MNKIIRFEKKNIYINLLLYSLFICNIYLIFSFILVKLFVFKNICKYIT